MRVAALLAMTAISMFAQKPDTGQSVRGADDNATKPERPGGSAPPIKVTARLVVLNVLVQDHSGHPVSGLSKDDFDVTDAGRQQTVKLFSANHLATKAPGPAPNALPRNIATNRPLTQEGIPVGITVVLIDQYNTNLMDQAYAKGQILKFLGSLEANQQVALYTLTSKGLAIAHDFTNNAASLRAAMTKMPSHLGRDLQASSVDPANTGDERLDQIIDKSNALVAESFTKSRIVNTSAALKSLAGHLSGIPGRKSLVWITDGVPMQLFGDLEGLQSRPGGNPSAMPAQSLGRSGLDKQDLMLARDRSQLSFTSYIDDVCRTLNNANVAIYPVDARGLQTAPFTDASKNFKMDPTTHGLPNSAFQVDNRNTATMNYLADMTGGKAFYNTNDIAEAARKVINDYSASYTLGYYVSASEWDNQYHKLKVSVRRPGVNVRTKRGYLAEDNPTPTGAQLEDTLKNAVWSPLDSTKLSVGARVDPSATLPNASHFSFMIIPSEFNLRQENGRYTGALDLLVIQLRKGGERSAEPKKTINLTLTPQRYQLMLQNGMLLTEDLTMYPDTVAVRIIFLDRASGATGSLMMKIDPEDKSGPKQP